MKEKVLLIIPAYNEAENIEKTVKDVKNNCNVDYIIVNDCSKDKTLEICKKNNFNVISLPINYGLTSGIQLGMKYAVENNYDIVIQFDGDGQHKAKYISKMVKKMSEKKANVIIGSRFLNEKKPFNLRMLGSRILSFVIFVTTRKKITDPTSGMRAFDNDCIKKFVLDDSLTPESDTLVFLIKEGYKISEVQVEMDEREFGESYLNLFKSIEYMTSMLLSIFFIRFITRGKKRDI